MQRHPVFTFKPLIFTADLLLLTVMKPSSKYYALLGALLFSFGAVAQISNGNFESNSGLPNNTGQWSLVQDWNNAGSTNTSPDYFHNNGTLGGDLPETPVAFVDAFEGNAVMGFVATGKKGSNYREYLTNVLSTPLVDGEKYKVSFYITNGEITTFSTAGLGTSKMGIYFSTAQPTQSGNAPLNLTPQFERQSVLHDRDWVKLSFAFIADDNYSHMTLGVFGNDSDKQIEAYQGSDPVFAYYFVDAFEIEMIPQVIMDDRDERKVEEKEVVDEVEAPHFYVPNSFTPNGDGDNDIFIPVKTIEGEYLLNVYNRWGELCHTAFGIKASWDGRCANGDGAPSEAYIWEIIYQNPDPKGADPETILRGTVNLLR